MLMMFGKLVVVGSSNIDGIEDGIIKERMVLVFVAVVKECNR